MEKKVKKYQVALFFASQYTDKLEQASLKIKETFGESKDTQFLPAFPVPQVGNFDIPGLMLAYDDFQISFGRSRVDFVSNPNEKVIEEIKKFIDVVAQGLAIKVGRIGFVKTYFIEKNNDYLKTFLAQDKIQSLNIDSIGLKDRINSNEDDLRKQSDKNIEILGIFSAILALIIIDVSIIKSVESFLAAILLIIGLTCSMLIFMSAVHYFFSILEKRKLGMLFWLPAGFLVVLLALGVWAKWADSKFQTSIAKTISTSISPSMSTSTPN